MGDGRLKILAAVVAFGLVQGVSTASDRVLEGHGSSPAHQQREAAKEGGIYIFLSVVSLVITVAVALSVQFPLASAEQFSFSPKELSDIVEVKLIGQGAQGQVFKVLTANGEVFALKTMRGYCGDDSHRVGGFVQEMLFLAELRHSEFVAPMVSYHPGIDCIDTASGVDHIRNTYEIGSAWGDAQFLNHLDDHKEDWEIWVKTLQFDRFSDELLERFETIRNNLRQEKLEGKKDKHEIRQQMIELNENTWDQGNQNQPRPGYRKLLQNVLIQKTTTEDRFRHAFTDSNLGKIVKHNNKIAKQQTPNNRIVTHHVQGSTKILTKEGMRDADKEEILKAIIRWRNVLNNPCILLRFVGDTSLEGYFAGGGHLSKSFHKNEAQVAQTNVPKSVDTVLKFVKMILQVYESVHKRHVVHNDVKAENILVTSSNRSEDFTSEGFFLPYAVHVTDFGMAYKVRDTGRIASKYRSHSACSYCAGARDLFRVATFIILPKLLSMPLPSTRFSSGGHIPYTNVHGLEQIDLDLAVDAQGNPCAEAGRQYEFTASGEVIEDGKISCLVDYGWVSPTTGEWHKGIKFLREDPNDPEASERLSRALAHMLAKTANATTILADL